MSHDLTLVSTTEPTDADVRRACAGVRIGRRPVLMEGSFTPEKELAEQGLDIGIIILAMPRRRGPVEDFAALYTPSRAEGEPLEAVSTELGFAAPVGDDGTAWITTGAMPGNASDRQIMAALDVCAALARQHGGYLLANGSYVALDGVPTPRPAGESTR